MLRLRRLLEKLFDRLRSGGLKGGFSFILWLFRLFIEKVFGLIDARWGFWKLRYSCPRHNHSHRHEKNAGPARRPGMVTFVLPVKDDPGELPDTIFSLLGQTDPAWECLICIDDGSRLKHLGREILGDARIKVITYPAQKSVGQLTDDILGSIGGGWLVLTWPGDRHGRNLVGSILRHEGDILYWDEDFNSGAYRLPLLKPGWSPEMWLSVDILRSAAFNTGHLHRIVRKAKGPVLRPACIFTAKRIIRIPEVLSHYRKPAWEEPRVVALHIEEVNQYLKMQSTAGQKVNIDRKGMVHLVPGAVKGLVSIIIPTKDHINLLSRCLDSIFSTSERTQYEIVIIDNQSELAETAAYYRRLEKSHHNVRVIDYGPEFNFSKACNLGARHAKGRYLLFLNNDVEVISPEWIRNLAGMASLDGVGVVGSSLLYPNRRIQHAGIIVGLDGHAGHVWKGSSGKHYSPFGLSSWYRNYSAVTGACLMTRKDVFDRIRGFDEKYELVFNDVDYCLRAGNHGYRTVYNPDVVLVHYEGQSRGRRNPESDIHLATERFHDLLSKGDPYFHPDLSISSRIPTLKFGWEQASLDKVECIARYGWY